MESLELEVMLEGSLDLISCQLFCHYLRFSNCRTVSTKAEEIYTGVNYNVLYSNTGWILNPEPTSINVDMNEYAGTISLSASFGNEDFKTDFKQFSYKVDVTPALKQYSAKPSCNENGGYDFII